MGAQGWWGPRAGGGPGLVSSRMSRLPSESVSNCLKTWVMVMVMVMVMVKATRVRARVRMIGDRREVREG